jgi:hypothetical protein
MPNKICTINVWNLSGIQIRAPVTKPNTGLIFFRRRNYGRMKIGSKFMRLTPWENRDILIARYHEKIWVDVYTLRGDAVRIISVRRARKREANLYEEESQNQ